jgi:HD-GYP domain-containing protein (c-di-GMP phosphodiesterase class II)
MFAQGILAHNLATLLGPSIEGVSVEKILSIFDQKTKIIKEEQDALAGFIESRTDSKYRWMAVSREGVEPLENHPLENLVVGSLPEITIIKPDGSHSLELEYPELCLPDVKILMPYSSVVEHFAQRLHALDKITQEKAGIKNYTWGHSFNVALKYIQLASMLGQLQEEIAEGAQASLLHDIGKLAVDPSIVSKAGKLTADEQLENKLHVCYSIQILIATKESNGFRGNNKFDIIYCHHEKYDGSGYPWGLIGDKIPLSARIITVADSWCAMEEHRPYDAGKSLLEITTELEKCTGHIFDPGLVKLFGKYTASYV